MQEIERYTMFLAQNLVKNPKDCLNSPVGTAYNET